MEIQQWSLTWLIYSGETALLPALFIPLRFNNQVLVIDQKNQARTSTNLVAPTASTPCDSSVLRVCSEQLHSSLPKGKMRWLPMM